MKIDLNCDMGENIGNDEDIMPYITSANIACGFHAGDSKTMQATIRLAKSYGVAVGAHPSWLEMEGFGRREMSLPPDEVEALILYQVGALAAIAKAEGVVRESDTFAADIEWVGGPLPGAACGGHFVVERRAGDAGRGVGLV